ncbi:unnamed protein product [Trichobilharzia regenti]|nr:unnamed protein product [Trichobilharzia regenti]
MFLFIFLHEGIQHVAKKLGIDCAEAIVGWSFHAGGWAHPKTEGYVVCKESVPVLIDAWRAEQMNAAKAANEERTEQELTQSSDDFDISQKAYASEGWIRLGAADKAHLLPKIPVDVKKCVPIRRNPTRAKRKAHKYEESSSEESDAQIPSTKSDDSASEFVEEDDFSQ